MDDSFFQLSKDLKIAVLREAENKLNINAVILEKDIWVCWLLEKLFYLPEQIVFKGGTSLSKVFNLIQRFSEDIDLTIDYRHFIENIDFQNTSKSQLKKISESLKKNLIDYTLNIVKPHIIKYVIHEFDVAKFDITLSHDGEKLYFVYPSFLDKNFDYLRSHILIEFGARNSTEPNEKHRISTMLSEITDRTLMLPTASVNVLSPIRTFWEKATLIHVECHRRRFNDNPNRLSRHWYDLAKLADSWVGEKAIADVKILQDVILHKTAFFNSKFAHYDKCLNKGLQLIPNDNELSYLQSDYTKMVESGMFQGKTLHFDEMIEKLINLQKQINT